VNSLRLLTYAWPVVCEAAPVVARAVPPRRWSRVVAAVEFAFELHGEQRRKQADVPYVGHLLGAAAIVIDDGGDDDEVIAALLHDAPEDQGGRRVLTEIGRRFGPRVVMIVDACTDTYESPKPPWRARKEAWLARLPTAPEEALRVVHADKLHNARSIVTAMHVAGIASLDAFHGGRDGSLWYYRAVADALATRAPGPLADELLRTVDEMGRLAGQVGS
jgi:(p)ppGpp synthase/HD superfamily hydrolase